MKPHEEEWSHHGSLRTDVVHLTRVDGQGNTVSLGTVDSEPRAKLAAQAPAMARLLLKLQSRDTCTCACGSVTEAQETETVLRDAGVLE